MQVKTVINNYYEFLSPQKNKKKQALLEIANTLLFNKLLIIQFSFWNLNSQFWILSPNGFLGIIWFQ